MPQKDSDLESLAKEAAGNWQKFESFAWHDKPDHPQDWTIVYTSNRDSRQLESSNADAIEELIKPYLEADVPDTERDIFEEHHDQWAVKEAQTLARHSDVRLTLGIYGRTDADRLTEVVEKLGEKILNGDGNVCGADVALEDCPGHGGQL